MNNSRFGQLVKDSWEAPCMGNPMAIVTMKLKRLKPVLRDLNQKSYSNINLRVKAAREDLIQHQTHMANAIVDGQMRTKEKELLKIYVELSMAEKEFFKQKSRIRWL